MAIPASMAAPTVWRALLCVDGGLPERLLDATVPLLAGRVTWVLAHVIDARGRLDLGVLRGGIAGAGALSPSQRAAIEEAGQERAHAVLATTTALLRARGLASEAAPVRVGEPGREICAAAATANVRLIVLSASRRLQPGPGPRSVGHTARFVVDHAPCPVLLVRG